MFRRKIFIYTVMYAAGIVTAYLICEKGMILFSCLFLLSVLAALRLAGSTLNGFEREQPAFCEVRRSIPALILLGAALFTASHFSLEAGEGAAADPFELTGTVSSVTETDDRLQLILTADAPEGQRPSDGDAAPPLRKGERILCNYYFGGSFCGSGSGGIPRNKYELIGRRVRLSGSLRVPDGRRNPGCFDYRLYLKTRNIRYILTVSSIGPASSGSRADAEAAHGQRGLPEGLRPADLRYSIKRLLLTRRADFEAQFEGNGEISAMLSGILFGDRSSIDDEMYEEFTSNGTAHILAVSGLHIGFIFAMLNFLSKRRRTVGTALLIAALLMLYGELTMWNASTVRSVIICTTGLFAMYLGRPFDLLSAISSAALAMLIARPYYLFNAGFCMSYLAVTGISFGARALKFFTGEYLAFIASVQLAVAPYSAFTFNRLNPLSMLINIPVVYIASLLVPFALLTFVGGAVTGVYPQMLTDGIALLTDCIVRLNSLLTFDGSFAADVSSVNPGVLAGAYALLALILSENTRIRLIRRDFANIGKLAAAALLPAAVLGAALCNPFLRDEVVFIDVGQGDAVHLRAGGADLLFDGGGSEERNIGKEVLRPYFLKNGVRRIDRCVLSHLHTDHCKGAFELAEIFPVGGFDCSELYGLYPGLPEGTELLSGGDVLSLPGGCSVEVIWPLSGEAHEAAAGEADENENSMVTVVNIGQHRVMLTGDLTEEDELAMVDHYRGTDTLRCDVLKIAHHGSRFSTCDEFLDEVNPAVAVITAGKNNIYGHPHEETLARLSERGIRVYRTDLDGAIGLDLDGEAIVVDTLI